MELFDLLETFHHMIEHWEQEKDHTPVEHTPHDDSVHQSQVRFWLSLFAALRLAACLFYLVKDQTW